MTVPLMERDCSWCFPDDLQDIKPQLFQWKDKDEVQGDLNHDISISPQPIYHPSNSRETRRNYIGLHSGLVEEIQRQANEVSTMSICFPSRWKVIGKMNRRFPFLTLPEPCKSLLEDSSKKKKGSSRRSKGKNNANPIPRPSPSKKGSPRKSMDRHSEFSCSTAYDKSEEWHDDLLGILTERYKLTGNKEEDLPIADELRTVVNFWNALPRHLNATWEIYNTLHRASEVRHMIEWLPDEIIAQRDRQDGIGNIATNERSYNRAVLEQYIVRNFFTYLNSRRALGEIEAEGDCGTIL